MSSLKWGNLRRLPEYKAEPQYREIVILCIRTQRRLGYLPLLSNNYEEMADTVHDITDKLQILVPSYLSYLSTKLDTKTYQPYVQNTNITYNTALLQIRRLLNTGLPFHPEYSTASATINFLLSHIYNVLKNPSQPVILQTVTGLTGVAPMPPDLKKDSEKSYMDNLKILTDQAKKSEPPIVTEEIGEDIDEQDEEQPRPPSPDDQLINAIRGAGFTSERISASLTDLSTILAMSPVETGEAIRRLISRHKLSFKTVSEGNEVYWVENSKPTEPEEFEEPDEGE